MQPSELAPEATGWYTSMHECTRKAAHYHPGGRAYSGGVHALLLPSKGQKDSWHLPWRHERPEVSLELIRHMHQKCSHHSRDNHTSLLSPLITVV